MAMAIYALCLLMCLILRAKMALCHLTQGQFLRGGARIVLLKCMSWAVSMGATDVQALRVIGITAMAWGLRAPSGIDRFWMRGMYGALDSISEAKPKNAGDTYCDAGEASRRRMASFVGAGAGRAEKGVMA